MYPSNYHAIKNYIKTSSMPLISFHICAFDTRLAYLNLSPFDFLVDCRWVNKRYQFGFYQKSNTKFSYNSEKTHQNPPKFKATFSLPSQPRHPPPSPKFRYFKISLTHLSTRNSENFAQTSGENNLL